MKYKEYIRTGRLSCHFRTVICFNLCFFLNLRRQNGWISVLSLHMFKYMRKRALSIIILVTAAQLLSANDHRIKPEHTRQAEEIVSQMTLQEKLEYIGGDGFYIRSIPRLGLPAVRMADGPQGVRLNIGSTLFPSSITTAASWDRELMGRMGVGLGQDARARGIQILLGPGVNIYRSPLCGRNFEYFGEDPYLASEMAVSYINGVQSQNVMACIKHFAGNNQEWARHTTSTDVDPRTLHEIYLQTFEKAVKKADVASVMSSYNLLNSVHSTENAYLNKTVLRGEWGFKGILMSDWTATYSPLNAAMSGLDLEMPVAKSMTVENLRPLVENGVIDERFIDEKCVDIIQTLLAWGWLDPSYNPTDSTISLDNPYSDNASLDISRSAITLLSNEGGFLPKPKGSFFVCGPFADEIVTGGGSGNVLPIHTCSVSEGLSMLGKKVKVSTSRPSERTAEIKPFCYDSEACVSNGIKAEFFRGTGLSGKPAVTKTVDNIDFNWGRGVPVEGLPKDKFSIRFTFWYKPAVDEFRTFELGADDGFRMMLDGKVVMDNWKPHTYRTAAYSDWFEAGRKYKFVVEYFEDSGEAKVDIRTTTMLFGHDDEMDALKKAECAVICTGFSGKTEGEDFDRGFDLPYGQVKFIEKVAGINPNVVVVVNAGGAFELASWMDKVKAVIWAGYPGQQGGWAVAEVICGKICPSGRLPFSMERVIEDNPCKDSYYENVARIRSFNPYVRVQYNEGLFVGYRGYDASGKKPLFPFGYGLSYTTFSYSDIAVEEMPEGFEVSFNVTNTGGCDGADVAQIYVSAKDSPVIRPVKELKGFAKFSLKKGEKKRVSVLLDRDEAFRYFDSYESCYKVAPGSFDILVGRSAENIVLDTTILIK